MFKQIACTIDHQTEREKVKKKREMEEVREE